MSDRDDEERVLMGVWLERLMFGWIADAAIQAPYPIYTETRSFEEYRAAVASRRSALEGE